MSGNSVGEKKAFDLNVVVWVGLYPQRLPWWLRLLRVFLHCGRPGFSPWVGKIPWRRKWQPTPVFLPRKSHAQRSLAGYSPQGHIASDMTEQLTNCPQSLKLLKAVHMRRALVTGRGVSWDDWSSLQALQRLSLRVSECSELCRESGPPRQMQYSQPEH